MPVATEIPVDEAVVNALESAGKPLTPKQMAGYEEAKHNSIKSAVLRMEKAGDLERVGAGLYELPDRLSETTPDEDTTEPPSEQVPTLTPEEQRENPSLDAIQRSAGEMVDFLFFRRIKANAGTGLGEFLEGQTPHRLQVHRFIVRRTLGIQSAGPIGAVDVAGDCMEPDIRDGDPVFFDITRRLEGSGRHVLWTGGEPQVKRVQTYTGGAVRITCDNKAADYQDEVLVPNQDGAYIHQETGQIVDFWPVGPVLWPRQAVSRQMMQEIKQLLHSGYAEGPHTAEGQRAMKV